MYKGNHLDRLISNSFSENLNKLELDSEVKTETLYRLQNKKWSKKFRAYYKKTLSVLNYEVEIPVTYVLGSISVLIFFYSYQISGIIPDSSEISAYNFNWIINNYKGMS